MPDAFRLTLAQLDPKVGDVSGNAERALSAWAQGKAEGRNWTFLMGNHDRMFSWFMEDFPRHDPLLLVELNWLK